MHMQQVQRFCLEHFQHFGRKRQRVRRVVKERIARDFNFMEKNVGIVQVHPDRRRVADEMNIVSARSQLLAKFGSHDAGAAISGITGYADAHE